MKALAIYEPKHEIRFFDGTVLKIDSSRKAAFFSAMEAGKFVKIGDGMYAVSGIKCVVPESEATSLLERTIAGQTERVKNSVRQTASVWNADNPHKTLTEAVILNMIEKHA